MLNKVRDWLRAKRNRYEPQHEDSRDIPYVVSGNSLPSSVDLSTNLKRPRSQGWSNACTGFATAGLIEYHLSEYFGKDYKEVSPLYTWYMGKTYHGYEDENNGVWLRYTLKSLYKYGFLYEQEMPFGQNYLREPSLQNYQLALIGKMYFDKTEYQLLDPSEVKDALAQGLPVVFGIKLNNSFYGNKTGIITTSNPGSNSHALLAIGYDDSTSCFKCRNSWGASWGDGGYCYVPYSYFDDYAHDCWTINEKVKQHG